MINIYQPSVGKEELESIKKVFESNWIGRGPKTEEFEHLFSNKINVDRDNVCTTGGCTQGINTILEFLDLNKDDEIIIPSLSFIGIANSVVSVGGKLVFCDVDERTLNTNLNYISDAVTDKTKVVILIHYAGTPCEDIDEIARFCKDKNIILIEDNACSPFSKHKGKNTGTIGDFGIWSFDAMKVMTTGDGGMVYCKDKRTMSKLREYLYFGLITKSGLSNKVDDRWWEFDISLPGRKSVVNDIISAIGIEQLNKVDKFIERRKSIHDFYSDSLKNLDWLRVPLDISKHIKSSYYMYWIQLEDIEDRDKLAKFLRNNDIYTTFRYYPLHWVDFYKKLLSNKNLQNTESAALRTLCIPLHPSLTDDEVLFITDKIKEYR